MLIYFSFEKIELAIANNLPTKTADGINEKIVNGPTVRPSQSLSRRLNDNATNINRFLSLKLLFFNRAIHLSNFSVQKNFENATTRSSMLPDENMWTSGEFQQYLKNRGCGSVWQDSIYPGMKKAVIAALQCTQDIVEMRKVWK